MKQQIRNSQAAPQPANGVQAAILVDTLVKAHPEPAYRTGRPESEWPQWMQDLHLSNSVRWRNRVFEYNPMMRRPACRTGRSRELAR